MAWEYIDLPETGTYGGSTYFTWEQGLGISPGTEYTAPGLYLSVGSGMLNYVHGGSVGPFTTSYGLSVTFRDGTSYASGLDINANNVNYCSWGSGFDALTYRFAINRETEDSAIIMMRQWRKAYNKQFTFLSNIASTNDENRHDLYLFLIAQLEPTYNWQSVPSISGKNGILSLVTLDSEAINDGEPVSGAAISVFDQAPSTDNNVKDLADTYGSGEESSAVDVTVKYKVTLPPGGSFSVLKLVAKKDSIPEDATDGDKIVDISPTKTKKTVTGLDENSMYYFKIFAEDSNSNTSESDEKHILTSGDEGYNFDYTGEIVEWTVPKTGIYSLETWGAQGGEATDGTNSARGGYGAYAYGEVLLTQGEKLYINVGGQNGYGGGGNYTSPNE